MEAATPEVGEDGVELDVLQIEQPGEDKFLRINGLVQSKDSVE